MYECRLRGVNRIRNNEFLPGDRVLFHKGKNHSGIIEKPLPRRNRLYRPPVANVDTLIIVSALKDPAPDFMLIDRLTVLAFFSGIFPVLVINKTDLADNAEFRDSITGRFRKTGIRIVFSATSDGTGIDEITNVIKGGITVFAGPSGVGKTSILNCILPGMELRTGEISRKMKRGKHTTRHAELYSWDGNSYIVDTPGFSSLEFPEAMDERSLASFFPEINSCADCRFKDCLHNREPGCGVKKAVAEGIISEDRYNNYIVFLKEIQERRGRGFR